MDLLERPSGAIKLIFRTHIGNGNREPPVKGLRGGEGGISVSKQRRKKSNSRRANAIVGGRERRGGGG